MPYEHYTVPYCRPKDDILEIPANIGEILSGDKLHSSAYSIDFMVNKTCVPLCTVQSFDNDNLNGEGSFELFSNLLRDNYRVQMRIDNMPGIELRYDHFNNVTFMGMPGYPMGFVINTDEDSEHNGSEKLFINNHLDIYLLYHKVDDVNTSGTSLYKTMLGKQQESQTVKDVFRLVGFYVVPRSINLNKYECNDVGSVINDNSFDGEISEMDFDMYQPAKGDVKFSYSVIWRESGTRWRYRWEPLLLMNTHDMETNWFSITNAVLVLAAISFVIALILVRLLRRDLLRYAELDELLLYENVEEGKHSLGAEGQKIHGDYGGWKSVSNDVFRQPPYPHLLCICVGTGIQILMDVFVLLSISLTGLFSPANRGAFMSWAIFLYAALGFVGGYHASLLKVKIAGATDGILGVSLGTALLIPGLLLSIFLGLNMMVWYQGSSGAVPFSTFVVLFALWLFVNVPSTLIGSFFAYRHFKYGIVNKTWPTKTNLISRAIPRVQWWQNRYFMGFMLGIVPFLVSFAQLFFVLSKMLLHQFVYMHGFLFIVFWLLAIASAEVSLIAVYTSLSCEDYRWWWQAFLTPALSGVDMFLTVALFFTMTFTTVPNPIIILMIGHLVMLTILWTLFTGSVGFVTSLLVVNTIYGAVKAD